MLHAFKLYTGRDNSSHVAEGTVAQNDCTDVVAIHFKESAPHSSFDWHDAPESQYVITLSGTLEFTTRDGEKFVLRRGDLCRRQPPIYRPEVKPVYPHNRREIRSYKGTIPLCA